MKGINTRLISCIIMIFLFTSNLFSTNYTSSKLTTLSGLSQNDVQVILQDSRGFVWIGTNDGLNRYDGYDYKVYSIGDCGLESNLFLALTEDKLSNFWIGTADKGIYYYNRNEEKFIPINKLYQDKKFHFPRNSKSLCIDADHNIWSYNGESSELIRISFDFKNEKIKQIHVINNEEFDNAIINEFLVDGDDLFLITNKGLFKFDKKANQLVLDDDLKFNLYSAKCIRNNKLIYSTADAIYVYDLMTRVNQLLIKTNASSRIMRSKNGFWYANQDGVHEVILDVDDNKVKTTQTLDHYSKYIIRTSHVDKSGTLWLGFLKEGVRKYEVNNKPFELLNGFGNEHVTSMFEVNKKRFLIGTEGTGAFWVTLKDDKYVVDPNCLLKNNTVYSIVYSPKVNRLFISSESAPILMIKENGKDAKSILPELKGVRSLITDGNYLWLGKYNDGVYRYNLVSKELEHFTTLDGLSSNIVRNLMKDHNGNIWIATDKGLCYIRSNDRWKKGLGIHQIINEEIKKDYIIPLMEDHTNNIWYGTLGRGLKKISLNSDLTKIQVTAYTHHNGLSSNTVKSIVEDSRGKIWISTNRGINSIDPKTGKINVYDINDGLQDFEFNELSSLKCSSGVVLFGGVNGMNSFLPGSFTVDHSPTHPVLTDFKLFNRSISTNEDYKSLFSPVFNNLNEINLKYNQNSFTFVFSALHFSNPSRNSYSYKLEGFNEEWVTTDASRREATYTNLKPGNYVFKLKATNSDGIWGNKILKINVNIAPPFWLTWYALIIYFMLFVYALYRLREFYLHRMERKNAILIANIEKKKSEELLEMKMRFFTNISHEFRTPLTLILSPLQTLLEDDDLKENQKWKEALNVMKHNGNTLMRLINELLSFSKSEKGKLKLQLQYLSFSHLSLKLVKQFDFWANQRGVSLKYVASDHKISFLFDPYLMEQVIYNLLSNAIKHTPNGGEVLFQVDNYDDKVCFKISDTGNGIPKKLRNHLFERFYSQSTEASKSIGGTGIGLFLSKNLIEMHDGTITFESKEGEGTTFLITLPRRIKNEQQVSETPKPLPQEEANKVEDIKPEESLLPESTEDGKQQKRTMLVVDDNQDICRVLSSLFSNDFMVHVAYDGEEALERIHSLTPDIIISDVMMPKMNGFELCKKVKADEATSHIPVILLTAKTAPQDYANGYHCEADSYCPKPFDNNVLIEMVRSIILNRLKMAKRFKGSIVVSPSEVTTTLTDERFIQKLIKYIEDNLHNSDLVVDDVCSELGVSRVILNKKLKSLLNTTTKAFIRSIRMKRAAQLLSTGRYTVADVTYDVGFNDLKYFRECFKKEFGVLPQKYKEANVEKSEN